MDLARISSTVFFGLNGGLKGSTVSARGRCAKPACDNGTLSGAMREGRGVTDGRERDAGGTACGCAARDCHPARARAPTEWRVVREDRVPHAKTPSMGRGRAVSTHVERERVQAEVRGSVRHPCSWRTLVSSGGEKGLRCSACALHRECSACVSPSPFAFCGTEGARGRAHARRGA